jgi:membrane-associated phospholipid phosphatase
MIDIAMKALKYTGKYGPLILFFPTVFLLWNKKNALMYYVLGFCLNSISNIFLKLLIRQPRPSDDKQKFDLALDKGKRFLFDSGIPYDVFGMPSGHSQSIAFTTVFVFMTIPNNAFRLFCVLIALITLWQRVHYNHHTVMQVTVGSMVGGFFAYLMFYMNRKNIAGKIKERVDDNAPI